MPRAERGSTAPTARVGALTPLGVSATGGGSQQAQGFALGSVLWKNYKNEIRVLVQDGALVSLGLAGKQASLLNDMEQFCNRELAGQSVYALLHRERDRFFPDELPVLLLELGDPRLLFGRHAWPQALVDLGLGRPVPQRLGLDAELAGDPAHGPVALT